MGMMAGKVALVTGTEGGQVVANHVCVFAWDPV